MRYSDTHLSLILEINRPKILTGEASPSYCERNYLVRIGTSSFETVRFAWDKELDDDLMALKRPGCGAEILQRLGRRLREFVRGTDWPHYEAKLLAALADGMSVYVTLCSNASELYELPWDLLTLDASGQHLGEVPGVLLRYTWPRTRTVEDQAAQTPGRVLLAWSAAAGEVPIAAHCAALRVACKDNPALFDEERDVLAHVSWKRLHQALAAAMKQGRPVRMLHIVCHGVSKGKSVCLAWNDEEDEMLGAIDGGRLRQLLAQFVPQLRVVVLCACNSSRASTSETYLGSIAQNLHRIGIETVIGSVMPLSARGSITFTEAFYDALLTDDKSATCAFLAARHALASHIHTLDWVALRLYSRPEDTLKAAGHRSAHTATGCEQKKQERSMQPDEPVPLASAQTTKLIAHVGNGLLNQGNKIGTQILHLPAETTAQEQEAKLRRLARVRRAEQDKLYLQDPMMKNRHSEARLAKGFAATIVLLGTAALALGQLEFGLVLLSTVGVGHFAASKITFRKKT